MSARLPGRRARAWAVGLVLGSCGATAAAQSVEQARSTSVLPGECARIEHDATRLACYDRWAAASSARTREDAPGMAPAESRSAADASDVPGVRDAPHAPNRAAAASDRDAAAAPNPAGGFWTAFWELDGDSRRGTFNFRTYRPNYFLPLFYSGRLNGMPSSPTQGAPASPPELQRGEARLQLSVRTKLAQGMLADHDGLWFGYTQQSMWQIWNRSASSPFRSSDYEPELIYVTPLPRAVRTLPGGWRFSMLQFGLAHQSNGQTDPLSRSWNRVYLGAGLQRGGLSVLARLHHRLREDADEDDNPDLTRYLGRGDVQVNWISGRSTVSLLWRTDFKRLDRGSAQLSWTYPVDRDRPDGLRWYLQAFSGYGQTLLDYNFRQTSVGAGLTLFEF